MGTFQEEQTGPWPRETHAVWLAVTQRTFCDDPPGTESEIMQPTP